MGPRNPHAWRTQSHRAADDGHLVIFFNAKEGHAGSVEIGKASVTAGEARRSADFSPQQLTNLPWCQGFLQPSYPFYVAADFSLTKVRAPPAVTEASRLRSAPSEHGDSELLDLCA